MRNKFVITEFRMKYFISVIIILLGLSGVSEAQINKKAQVGFRFLENPVSAEVVGRGMVGIVNTYNSDAIFWNPALTGLITNTAEVSFNHTRGIVDINYNALSAAVRAGDFGVIGVSLLAMDYGTFYQTRRASNDQGYVDLGTFSPAAISGGISFSQLISSQFSYGAHLKYAYQDLGDAWISTAGDSLNDPTIALETKKYDNGAFALDVGAFYDFQYNGIKFAAVLQNISQELKYESQKFPLPFSISFGATVEPLMFLSDRSTPHAFVLSLESRHPRDYGEKLKIGGEYSFDNMFFLRGGYATNYDERRWSAGVGLNYTLLEFPLKVNYAIQPFGLFGNVHFISLGISYL
jgi:hypothetical protein